MWMLLQGMIILAVVFSNIRWQWTPNGLLATLIGVGLALAVTAGIGAIRDRLRRAGAPRD